MQEPARAGRDEWQSLGGQDPSLQKPFNPPRSTIKTDGTVAPTPAQNTPPQVTISGADPAVLKKNGLAIAFAPGSRAAERIQVSRVRTFPPIRGTAAELKAYKGLQRISDVWEIKEPPGAAEPFEIELRFDPSAARGKDLMLLAVSDGRVWTPSVLAAGPDYVIAESEHFSTWFVVVSTIALAALVGVAWQAKSFTNNEATPWRLIEPGHPKIKEFIQKNNLSLPSFTPDTQRVNLKNYNKVFKEREDTHFNRVVHLTGKRGSEVLNESKVACWDLTTLFASILYTLDPSIGPRIRMVKGTAGGNRHSWIEVVIDGQVFVVNTGAKGLTDFQFVSRDVLYKEHKLEPSQFYTKDINSLHPYDANWFKPYLGTKGETQAKIDALKARHAALQDELEQLRAFGTSIKPAQEARMDAIRAEQKEIYKEVKALQKTLNQ